MKKHWYLAAVAVLLSALVVVGVLQFRQDRARPVMVSGDFALDNTTLAYYYWSEYFYFAEAYGDYLSGSVDFTEPLSDQPYDADRSWEDYLLEETFQTVRDTMTMVFAAEAQGFQLPTDYAATYQQVLVNFASAATEGGYADLNAYLRDSYGPQAHQTTFEAYLHDSHLAAAYSDHLLAQLQPTRQEVLDHFALHQAAYEEQGLDPAAEETWFTAVEEDLISELYQNQVLALRTQYPFQIDPTAVRLTPPTGLYD